MVSDNAAFLAVTARFTAAARARESARPDPLVVDPWATLLAGDVGFGWLNRLPPAAALWPLVRTRFIDDCLDEWRNEPALRQTVLVAAGLDTRAYRRSWPDMSKVFEIDRPDVLAHKATVLARAGAAPRTQRIAIAADLRRPWETRLVDSGFDPGLPAVWIVEGLLMYLDGSGLEHVLATISRLAAPGSRLSLDTPRQTIPGHAIPEPETWLHHHGWDAAVVTLARLALRYGRWPFASPPTAEGSASRVFLISALRQAT